MGFEDRRITGRRGTGRGERRKQSCHEIGKEPCGTGGGTLRIGMEGSGPHGKDLQVFVELWEVAQIGMIKANGRGCGAVS